MRAEEGPSALEDVVERLQAQLDAALAAREQEEQELAVSQRQTESAVGQLREAHLRMDEMEVHDGISLHPHACCCILQFDWRLKLCSHYLSLKPSLVLTIT